MILWYAWRTLLQVDEVHSGAALSCQHQVPEQSREPSPHGSTATSFDEFGGDGATDAKSIKSIKDTGKGNVLVGVRVRPESAPEAKRSQQELQGKASHGQDPARMMYSEHLGQAIIENLSIDCDRSQIDTRTGSAG